MSNEQHASTAAADIDSLALDVARRFTEEWDPQRRASLQVAIIRAIHAAHAQPAELAEQQGGCGLHDVAEKLRRAGATIPAPIATGTIESSMLHGLCIALLLVEEAIAAPGKQQVGEMQGDARAQFKGWWEATRPLDGRAFHYEIAWQAWQAALAARQPGAQGPVAWMDPDGSRVLTAKAKENASGAYRSATAGYTVPLYTAPPAQGIDLGPVRELLRRRIAQWRTHLPSDPGAPGTVAISSDGEGGYNNDVRIYREGIALMDQVLALIDNPRDAASGVSYG